MHAQASCKHACKHASVYASRTYLRLLGSRLLTAPVTLAGVEVKSALNPFVECPLLCRALIILPLCILGSQADVVLPQCRGCSPPVLIQLLLVLALCLVLCRWREGVIKATPKITCPIIIRVCCLASASTATASTATDHTKGIALRCASSVGPFVGRRKVKKVIRGIQFRFWGLWLLPFGPSHFVLFLLFLSFFSSFSWLTNLCELWEPPGHPKYSGEHRA